MHLNQIELLKLLPDSFFVLLHELQSMPRILEKY